VVGGKGAWRKRDKNQTLLSCSPSSRLNFSACFDYFSGYPNDMVMVMFARVYILSNSMPCLVSVGCSATVDH
jgi:hypothetical protein